MSMWALLLIPGTLAVLVLVLTITTLAETRIVSPRALILRAVTGRTTPDIAERLVAAEVERLLKQGRL
jgi:hypothetical protein